MIHFNGDSDRSNGLDRGAVARGTLTAAGSSRQPYIRPQVRLMEMSETKSGTQGASSDADTPVLAS